MPKVWPGPQVGGVMVILTIYLVVLNPGYQLWIVVQGFRNQHWSYLRHAARAIGWVNSLRWGEPGWELLLAVLFCIAAAWGAYAGIQLWIFRRRAVSNAKYYFYFGGILLQLVNLLYSYSYGSTKSTDLYYFIFVFNRNGNYTLISDLIFLAIGLSSLFYLSRSRRVAAAYPLG